MNESANKVAKLRKIKISPDIILIKHSLPSERYFRSKNSVETKRENSQEERVALTRAIKRSYPASNEPISSRRWNIVQPPFSVLLNRLPRSTSVST